MRIITLVGKPNAGKSLTIKNMIFKLIPDPSTAPVNRIKYLKDQNCLYKDSYDSCLNLFRNENSGASQRKGIVDITVIATYKNKKIFITSFGDSLLCLKSKYEKAGANFCDVFVCASHNDNSIVEWLQSEDPNTIFYPQADIQGCADESRVHELRTKRNDLVSDALIALL